MRYFAAFYLVLLAAALACGMPAPGYIAPSDTTTPVYQPTATVATYPPATVPARWQTVRVTGCWNLRETPGGMITGQACNRDLSVTVVSDGGWYESPLGWICGRAFGVDVACKTAH